MATVAAHECDLDKGLVKEAKEFSVKVLVSRFEMHESLIFQRVSGQWLLPGVRTAVSTGKSGTLTFQTQSCQRPTHEKLSPRGTCKSVNGRFSESSLNTLCCASVGIEQGQS